MADKKISVYASIAEDLIKKIEKGTFPVGAHLPAERELMARYSVQRTTIRRGLEILSAKGYIKKVAGLGSVVCSNVENTSAAQKIDAPKEEAPKKKSEKTNILLPNGSEKDINNLPQIMREVMTQLSSSDGLFVTDNKGNLEKTATVICLGGDELDGVKNTACLALSRSDDYRCVVLDSDKAAYTALTYLEELGHTKIAYVGEQTPFGFENAFYDSFEVVNSFFDENLVSIQQNGFEGFSDLFRRVGKGFTAICAPNDKVAEKVLEAAKYYKVSVPESVSVISLCTTDKKSEISGIYFDKNDLCDEIVDSARAAKRVSAVLFGGVLKEGTTCAKANEKDSKKNTDFLW